MRHRCAGRAGIDRVSDLMATLPFTDLLLLDLTRHRAGPVASRFFADWGAQVIRVEAPWDPSDTMGGKREGSDYQNLHRNKRSLSLNLKSDEGKSIFRKLAARADIVLESFRPAVKYRLGVDYEFPEASQSAHHLRKHFRLWANRPLCGAARRGSDHPGHVGIDVGHRLCRRRTHARRRVDRRCQRGNGSD